MIGKTLNGIIAEGAVVRGLIVAARAGGFDPNRWNRFERIAPEERERRTMQRIRRLVGNAVSRSSHHRSRLGIGPSDVGDLRTFDDFRRLPFLAKSELRRGGPEVLALMQPRLARTATTSGSTGVPVCVVHDLSYWSASIARRSMLFARHGVRFGSREARFWGRDDTERRSVQDVVGNRRFFGIGTGTDEALSSSLERLRGFVPDYAYGYPSVLLRFAEHARREGGALPAVGAVIRTAEGVTPEQERVLRETFDAPLVNEYGCSEVEIIAFDCEDGACHVDTDHIHLEVVESETGALEAVVTDLDNATMPILRYRLGDDIRLSEGKCTCGRTSPVIASVEGRSADRLLQMPDGSRRHSVVFSRIFARLDIEGFGVTRFRVVQTAPERLEIFVEGLRGDFDAFDRRLREAVEEEVSADFEVRVQRGPLPTNAGGKHRYFVPLESNHQEMP